MKKPSKDTCHPSTFNGPHLPTHFRVWEPPRALVMPVNLLSPPGSNTGEAPHKTHCLAPGIRRKGSGGGHNSLFQTPGWTGKVAGPLS